MMAGRGASQVVGQTEQKAPAQATGRIEGIVVDGLSQPLVAADVWLVDEQGASVARTKTDGGGLFVLGRVPLPQTWYWEVRAAAPACLEAADHVRPRDGAGTARLRLFDASRLTGRVVDAEGAGIAGAQVAASYNRSRVLRNKVEAITDAEGRFELEKVALGLLDVRATALGYECGATEVHVTGAANGEPPVTVQLARGEGLRLAVQVAGLSAEDAATVRVRLLPYLDGSLLELPSRLVGGTLGAEGTWRTAGLPRAQYKVWVSAPGLSFEPREVDLYSEHRGARVLGTPAAPTDDPVARFKGFRIESVVLRGKLVDEAGKGIAGEAVVARASNGGQEVTTRTGEDGAFALVSPLAPGTEGVFFLRDSPWITAQEPDEQHRFDRRNLLWHRARIDPARELVLHARRAAVVRGRLVDGEGRPVRWTDVELEESSPSRGPTWMRWIGTVSARDGTFSFRVTALENPVRVAVSGPNGAGLSRELELRWGASHDVGDVVLSSPAAIAGVVRDAQKNPVPGARVWLRDWDFGTNQQKSGSVVETITDRQGRYRFAGVPPGGAWLQVMLLEKHSTGRAVEPFDVEAGDDLVFDLVLQ